MEQIAPFEKVKIRDLAATVTSVFSSQAGIFGGIVILNNAGAACFVQIFDVALPGGVTLGTTTPDLEFTVASGGSVVLMPFPSTKFRFGCQAASTTLEKGSVGSAAGVQVFVLVQ